MPITAIAEPVCEDEYEVYGFPPGDEEYNGIYKTISALPCQNGDHNIYENDAGIFMFYYFEELVSRSEWYISRELCVSSTYKAKHASNVDTLYPPVGLWYQYGLSGIVANIAVVCNESTVEVFLVDPQLYQQSIQDSVSLILDDDPTTCLQLTRSDLQDTPMTLSFYSDNMLNVSLYSIIGQGLFCYNAQACPPTVISMKTGDFSDTTSICTLQTSQQDYLFTVCQFLCQCQLGCQHVNVTFIIDAIAHTARKLKLCGGSVDDAVQILSTDGNL